MTKDKRQRVLQKKKKSQNPLKDSSTIKYGRIRKTSLTDILIQCVSDGHLMPTFDDVRRVSSIIKPTISEFMSIPWNYFFGSVREKLSNVMENYVVRAQILCSLIKPHICHVVMMDGHGRFLRVFFEIAETIGIMSRIRSGDLYIHIVDIDEIVDRFHQLFFPREVNCVHTDIFDFTKNMKNVVPYANFCGISHDPVLFSFIEETPSYMISFMGDIDNRVRPILDKKKINECHRGGIGTKYCFYTYAV